MKSKLTQAEERRFVNAIKAIAAKPSMHLSEPTYWGLCSFIEGYDLANDGVVLGRFKKWRKRKRVPQNLGWSAAFLYTVFNEISPTKRVTNSPKASKLAISRLAETFETILLPSEGKRRRPKLTAAGKSSAGRGTARTR